MVQHRAGVDVEEFGEFLVGAGLERHSRRTRRRSGELERPALRLRRLGVIRSQDQPILVHGLSIAH